MKSLSIDSLLDWLEAKSMLEKRSEAEVLLLCEQNLPTVPIPIHILMGFGALVGCMCIYGLLFAMNILSRDDYSFIFAGILFMGIAYGLYYSCRYSQPLLHSFATQCALIFMLLGKSLFVYGAFLRLPANWDYWSITISLAFITSITYFTFPNVIDRFLSVLATLTALVCSFSIEFNNNIGLFAVYLVVLASIYTFYQWRNRSKKWDALILACIIFLALLAISISNQSYTLLSRPTDFWKISPLYFNIALGLFTIGLCFTFSRKMPYLNNTPFMLAMLCIFALSCITNNGIILALALLILGYGKHLKSFITLGSVFLVLFLFAYYYNLSVTLQQKSILLITTGAFLICVRFIIRYFKWDQD